MPGHLALAALVSWLATELLGALMLRSWIAKGGIRAAQRKPADPEAMSLPILAGHAGLNLTALLCWVVFVTTGVKPLAWIALGLMAPAIGLGISTVTIWTPYPGRTAPDLGETPPVPAAQPGVVSGDALDRALADERLSQQLVDDLISRSLAPETPVRGSGLGLRPLVPLAHGVLAIATFMLAVLAAIAAS
jgi:manganese efflux pump family protein